MIGRRLSTSKQNLYDEVDDGCSNNEDYSQRKRGEENTANEVCCSIEKTSRVEDAPENEEDNENCDDGANDAIVFHKDTSKNKFFN